DRAIERFLAVLTPADALFVTADHGMTPLHTELFPSQLLVENGFTKVRGESGIDPSSAAAALASSGVAHVYVNPAAPAGAVARVEAGVAGFRAGGESPWDRVVRREAAGDLGLDAPESGDLIILAKPGYHFSMAMKPGRVSGPSEEYGGHGYRAAYPELDATFLAAGAGGGSGRAPGEALPLPASRGPPGPRGEPPRHTPRRGPPGGGARAGGGPRAGGPPGGGGGPAPRRLDRRAAGGKEPSDPSGLPGAGEEGRAGGFEAPAPTRLPVGKRREPEPLLPRRSPVLTDSQLPLPVADAPLEADRLCSGEHERFQDEAPARRELAGGGSNSEPPIPQPGQEREGIGRRGAPGDASVEDRRQDR